MPPEQRTFKSSFDIYRKTLRSQGPRGLWVGWTPNVCRNSIMNACELASYDQFKQVALGYGMPDQLSTHIACAWLTGLVVVFVGSPVDVVKTRVMNRKPSGDASLGKLIVNMVRHEGPLSFYKGFTANFMRQGTWITVMFVSLEKIRALYATAPTEQG